MLSITLPPSLEPNLYAKTDVMSFSIILLYNKSKLGHAPPSEKKYYITTSSICDYHRSFIMHMDKCKQYCLRCQAEYGLMLPCGNAKCTVMWFHLLCVGLATAPKGKCFCPKCDYFKTLK